MLVVKQKTKGQILHVGIKVFQNTNFDAYHITNKLIIYCFPLLKQCMSVF